MRQCVFSARGRGEGRGKMGRRGGLRSRVAFLWLVAAVKLLDDIALTRVRPLLSEAYAYTG